MSIESIERPEDRLVKVVKGLVATHGNQTPNALAPFRLTLNRYALAEWVRRPC
jgi:hypothetical protein